MAAAMLWRCSGLAVRCPITPQAAPRPRNASEPKKAIAPTRDIPGTASFRSHYIPQGGVNPGNLNDFLVNSSTLNIDASASYKIDENFTVTFDGLNLTNQQTFQYADSVGQRLYYNHSTGANYFLGVRYSY